MFFKDLSGEIIKDDIFKRLLTFLIIITSHQAFFIVDALINIVEITLFNIKLFESQQECVN